MLKDKWFQTYQLVKRTLIRVLSTNDLYTKQPAGKDYEGNFKRNAKFLYDLQNVGVFEYVWDNYGISLFIREEMRRVQNGLDDMLTQRGTSLIYAVDEIVKDVIGEYESQQKTLLDKGVTEGETDVCKDDVVTDVEMEGKATMNKRRHLLQDAINYILGHEKSTEYSKTEVVKFLADLRDWYSDVADMTDAGDRYERLAIFYDALSDLINNREKIIANINVNGKKL